MWKEILPEVSPACGVLFVSLLVIAGNVSLLAWAYLLASRRISIDVKKLIEHITLLAYDQIVLK